MLRNRVGSRGLINYGKFLSLLMYRSIHPFKMLFTRFIRPVAFFSECLCFLFIAILYSLLVLVAPLASAQALTFNFETKPEMFTNETINIIWESVGLYVNQTFIPFPLLTTVLLASTSLNGRCKSVHTTGNNRSPFQMLTKNLVIMNMISRMFLLGMFYILVVAISVLCF